MRSNLRTRIGSALLCLAMLMTLLPVTAFAKETEVKDATELTTAIANANSGDTIKLGVDITGTETHTIPEDISLTLDLNGKVLSLTQIKVEGSLTIRDSGSGGTYTSTLAEKEKSAIKVGAKGLLTLESGTIKSAVNNYGVYVYDGGKAIVNGGTIESDYAALAGNNTTGDMNFEIHGGTLTAKLGPAIYMPGQVSLTITDGTLNGGISLRMGQVNISGGTINAITNNDNIDSPAQYYNYGGNAWLPDALYVFNGTYTSGNTTYGSSLNLNITGGTFNCTNNQGSAVAIYDLGKVQQESKVSISGTAKLSSTAAGRGVYQVLSLSDIGVSSPAEGYGVYTGKVVSAISGGEFSSDVSKYVATGYKCTESGGKYTVGTYSAGELEVKPDASADSDTTSATLDGVYGSGTNEITNPSDDTSSTNTPSGEVEDNTVTVTLPTVSSATTASLNVAGDTVSSLAGNSGSLTIKSDVGNLEVSNDALKTISGNAKNSAVTLSIENKTATGTTDTATYELTAKDAGGNDVFTESSGSVKVSVPAPSGITGSTVYVYYLGPNGAEKITGVTVDSNNNVVWTVNHFSTYYITGTEQGVSVTDDDGNTTTYTTLQEAIDKAGEGDTIKLLTDVSLTDGVNIDEKITLDLNGCTITNAESWSPGANVDYLVAVKRGGNLTIKDSSTDKSGAITVAGNTVMCAVKMTIKGENATGDPATLLVNGGTISGYQYGIAGNGTRHGTSITINGGTIKSQATYDQISNTDSIAIYQPQNGTLEINGGTIKSSNTAIEIRSGSLTVNEGAEIKGGSSNPAVNSNGNGGTTTNTGIAIAQHTTKQPITVNITGGTISGGAAVYESDPQNNTGSNDNAVTVNVENAELNGNVYATGFGDIAMTNVTITDNVNNQVGEVKSSGEMAILNSTISGTVPETGITLLGCKDGNGDNIADRSPNNAVALVGAQTYEKLSDAITAATRGQTIVLLANITNDNYGTANATKGNTMLYVNKDLTIDGNGKSITLTIPSDFGDSDQAIGVGPDATLTLDGVKLSINGDETKHGDGIDVWASSTLKIINGSEVDFENLRSALTMQGGDSTKVEVTNSKVTADTIHGNFSNGGSFTLDTADIDINGCSSYGISANTITTKGTTTIDISDTAYSAIYGYSSIDFGNGTTVNVTDCGTSLPYFSTGNYGDATAPIQMKVKHTDGSTAGNITEAPLPAATLTVNQGASVTVSGTKQNIYLPSNTTYTNNGTVNATVINAAAPSGSYSVTVKDGDTVIKTAYVSSGGSFTLPAALAKTNYTFQGWNDGTTTHAANTSVENITSNMTFTAQWIYNGGGSSSGGGTTYYSNTVADVENGTVTVSPKNASRNSTVTITVKPDEGYELASLTVTDKNGKEIALTDKGDGKYTFKMPASKVTIQAAFQEIVVEPVNPFTDVSEGDYYYDAVLWAVENGITKGTNESGTLFSPHVTLTRAEMVTFLWRAAGCPEPTETEHPFVDVDSEAFYYDAMLWAVENGITNGTGDGTTFSPDVTVTRCQAVTFQWRAAGCPEATGGSFEDVAADAWYTGAVTWAVDNGITIGTNQSGTLFSPEMDVSRAQAVTFLYRELAQ